jgi:hypothetical protein
MKFPVNRLELTSVNLGVDLRCCDGGMAKHLLDDAQIGAAG